jgi:molecular chaperone GrpE (heat shock protein)
MDIQEQKIKEKIIEELDPIIEKKIRREILNEASQTENSGKTIEPCATIPAVEIALISDNVKQLQEKVEALIENDRKFNKMHEELDEYRKGLYRKLLSPILKNIVVQYSKVSDLHLFYERKQAEEQADKEQLFANLLKEYKNLQLSLSDLLYDYDIEIVEPQAGEEFNPKWHKAIKTVATDDSEKDRKIAACVTIGFKDVSANNQMVKYPEVEIFKINN